jgi:glutaredoxin-related protein
MNKITEEQLIAQMKTSIDNVLCGISKSEKLLGVRPGHALDYLKTLDENLIEAERQQYFEWDFSIRLSYNGKQYMISGDGYYQSSITFSLNENE